MPRAALVLMLSVILALPGTAPAAAPRLLEVQARLTDSGGAPVTDPTTVTLAIYDQDSGGVALHTEDDAVAPDGTGVFVTTLGDAPAPALPPGIFGGQLWLGVAIDGGSELGPRRPFRAAPYAFRAVVAEEVAATADLALGGFRITDLGNPTAPQDAVTRSYGGDTSLLQTASTTSYVAAINEVHADLGDPAALTTATTASLVAALNEVVARLAAVEAKLAAVTVASGDATATDGDLLITGVNLHVRNGLADTETTNGRGNLVIGYHEDTLAKVRTGSHNLVVGAEHGYSDFAGVVAGYDNSIYGEKAAAIGGSSNDATADDAFVGGGYANWAGGTGAVVVGGNSGYASGDYAIVAGGEGGAASDLSASVFGGKYNAASNEGTTALGGYDNDASGFESTIVGGYSGTASAGVTEIGDAGAVYVDGSGVH